MSKDTNTGSATFQIEGFTDRINSITKHLSTMKKDHSGRRGLLILVSKRKKLLNYLKKANPQGYLDVVNKLKLRK
tara:strand:+ start:194 stop:418 length:225 start_codon:yes stop_codon:yes gene_type:complete